MRHTSSTSNKEGWLTSQYERTHCRDDALSERHRRYGSNAPAVDLDFLLIEFDDCKPAALIEYKSEHAQKQYLSNPQFQVLINLGNMANLPAFFVRYAEKFTWFEITPLNAAAKNRLQNSVRVTEKKYVKFLYWLRNREAPAEVLNNLDAPPI